MIIDDNSGLFWSAPVRQLRGKGPRDKNVANRMAALPWDTSSYVQQELRDAPSGCVALDFETDDPTLLERGSAWAFSGIGDVIGMALAWNGFEAYFPIGHREGNVDRAKVVAWLTEHFKRDDVKFLCANAAYDLGWAKRITGLYPAGGVCDVQFMVALLDEHRLSYSLDNIAKDYLGVGKATDVIEDIAKKLGLKKYEVMGNLKQLPGAVVAPYAAMDARVTYDVYEIILPKILDEGLLTVHELESALIPMSVEMKRRGIRVNVDEASRISDDIKNRRMPELQDEIKRQTGVHVEPWEGETCERALMARGITCDRTRTGQAKIDQHTLAEWAKTEPVAKHILALRKMSKIQNTFLEGHILGHQHEGRIHADFNQLKSEREDGGYGTVSGRYSSTSPNLQQIPTRDKEWGPLMRSLFLAEDGEQIASLDYSSQEPRLMVHFAYQSRLPGAAEAVAQFKDNPRTDYHQMVAEIANIPRSQAKTINLGCFGPDTLVLTSNGVKPITYVTTDDMVWDGVEWTTHKGLLDQGVKDTIQILGDLFVTTDHRVLCGTRWVSAIALAHDGNIRFQALATGSANLPSQVSLWEFAPGSKRSLFSAPADHRNTRLIPTIYLRLKCSDVFLALKSVVQFTAERITHTLGRYLKTITESAYSHDCLQPSIAATIPTIPATPLMVVAESRSQKSGESRKENSFFTRGLWTGGMTRLLTWIERIIAVGMNPATSALSREKSTTITGEQSRLVKKSLPTYDIASAGPRSRFTIVTAAGPLIVHNCAYGMGGAKLAHSLGLPTEWMAVERKGSRHTWTPIEQNNVDEMRRNGVDCVEVAGDEAKAIMKKWEDGAPFVRGLYKLASNVAEKRGYIKTLLGRRCRFQIGKDGKFAFTHKAMNRLAQGSAADQTKRGMLDLWNMGCVPLLTVHDELVFSVENEAQARKYSPVMEHAVELEVPSIVDVNLGKTWGDVTK